MKLVKTFKYLLRSESKTKCFKRSYCKYVKKKASYHVDLYSCKDFISFFVYTISCFVGAHNRVHSVASIICTKLRLFCCFSEENDLEMDRSMHQ